MVSSSNGLRPRESHPEEWLGVFLVSIQGVRTQVTKGKRLWGSPLEKSGSALDAAPAAAVPEPRKPTPLAPEKQDQVAPSQAGLEPAPRP